MVNIDQVLDQREFNRRGLFPGEQISYTYEESIEMAISSLAAYGERYTTWMISYSGGKDSSAVLSFVWWAIQTGKVVPPEKLVVAYIDTEMELPPLVQTATKIIDRLKALGVDAYIVRPKLDDRFFVSMLGRGLPPPTRGRRWCTEKMKAKPMRALRKWIFQQYVGNVLNITGVRYSESSVRDARINTSCSKNDGECGQGWFHVEGGDHSLAPFLNWRVCHVWKWLFNSDNPFPELREIADVYLYDEIVAGDMSIRTGCIECFIVDDDWAFKGLLRKAKWQHLKPLTGLRPLYN